MSNNKLAKFIKPVFAYLQKIPSGKVTTYKIVAQKCGVPSPRNVGKILQQNTDAQKIPCYKVICSNGSLARGYKFGGISEQKERLTAEGVLFGKSGKINLEKFLAK